MRKSTKKPEKNEPLRVVAYVRVSTDQQVEQGHSLEAQTVRLEQYAVLYGLNIVSRFEDAGASAGTLDRPGLRAALACLESGEADGLLVVKLDRLTRSVRDLGDLIEEYFTEKALISVSENVDTSSASGRLVLNILATVGQWEREAIGERTSAVMQRLKEQGRFTGGWPPFGYAEHNGALVEDESEQAIIRRVRELRDDGASFREISASLERVGIVSRNGKAFLPAQIARML